MNEEEKLQIEQECLLKYSKAQMIQKYIDELEESIVLSNLWCKSQERINKAIEYKRQLLFDLNKQYITFEKWEEILEPFEDILRGEDKE